MTFFEEVVAALHQSVIDAHLISICLKIGRVKPQLISAEHLVNLIDIFLGAFDCGITQGDLEFHHTVLVDGLVILIHLPRVNVFVNGGVQLRVDLVFVLLKHPVDIQVSLKLSSVSI